MQKISGIYKIINIITNKYYVGSSNNIYRRWNTHKKSLNEGTHYNLYLQNSFNKYGINNFNFIIQEIVLPGINLLKIEQKYLDIAKDESNMCYNLTFIAGGGSKTKNKIKMFKEGTIKFIEKNNESIYLKNGWIRGSGPMSAETKRKIGNSNRGKKKPEFSAEHRKKLGETYKRRKSFNISEEHKKILRDSWKGHHHTEETKKKMSFDRLGEKHPLFGVPRSKETKLKLSKSLKGKFKGEKNPKFDTTIYSFINNKTNKIIHSTRYDFYTEFNLNPSNVNKMLKSKIKSISGWKCLNNKIN
jgi:group I intron endonuclease